MPAHGTTGTGHVAFRIEASEIAGWRTHLQEHGVAIEKEFAFGDNPPSIYFRDPDGNLVNFFTPISAEAIKKHSR